MRVAMNALAWRAEPASVEALHIQETVYLAARQPEIDQVILYQPASWQRIEADKLYIVRLPEPGSALRAAALEQWSLPRQARARGAQLLLSAYLRPSLFTRLPQAWLDSRFDCHPPDPDSSRLGRAFDRAVSESGAERLVSSDLPAGPAPGITRLAPWVDSRFRPERGADDMVALAGHGLRPGYVLVHGLSSIGVARILAAWTWVEGGVGDTYPLVVIAAAPEAVRTLKTAAEQAGLRSEIIVLSASRLDDLPAIYRSAALFFQLERVRSGQSLRWAQASGLPVAGIETATSASILGEAGYLAPANDGRALGAACLTLLVEEELRRALAAKGLRRAERYRSDAGELVSRLAAILNEPMR
ncbi:MAG: hypothetical protein P8X64_09075 [Anaerolineales bacterium]